MSRGSRRTSRSSWGRRRHRGPGRSWPAAGTPPAPTVNGRPGAPAAGPSPAPRSLAALDDGLVVPEVEDHVAEPAQLVRPQKSAYVDAELDDRQRRDVHGQAAERPVVHPDD